MAQISGGNIVAIIWVRDFQNVAPMVFGMISDRTSINSVRTAENIASDASPKTIAACAPAPAAPTVWATVLRLRIAARGRSTSFFNSESLLARAGLSASMDTM